VWVLTMALALAKVVDVSGREPRTEGEAMTTESSAVAGTVRMTRAAARYVGVFYGSVPYYELIRAGYRRSGPSGDIYEQCVMVAPGLAPMPGFVFLPE
jgi:hypothetical protein